MGCVQAIFPKKCTLGIQYFVMEEHEFEVGNNLIRMQKKIEFFFRKTDEKSTR